MKAATLDPGVEMTMRLRLACEAHDTTLGAHLDRVARYSCELARLLELPEDQVTALHHAAPLHDLGKIGLPVALLNKEGRLSAAEMEMMRSHTVLGHRILDGSEWPVVQCAAQIALGHHENWDGSGYPHRRCGAAIPLEARIVAVADVFDALLSQRSYKQAWELRDVIEEMRRLRGTKFDPALLDVFLEHAVRLARPAA